ncbi:MAG: NAD-dependent epimerase/dehydratase family protein [Candidatus Aenigmarchaeota archaeon]|nr:NAD-dependent epimerase/dehydratase family protein [Candidatus Aenigmarchaeota archaeon]
MNLEGKNVMVAGGAGFIGSHISERLVKEGARVVVFDSFVTGKESNLAWVKDKIRIIRGDILDYESLLKAMNKMDFVIHQAFPYGDLTQSVDTQFVDSGTVGTFNVLRAATKSGVKKVVYASSVAVYGQHKYLPIDEEHPKDPFYPYDVTKISSEMLCQVFTKSYGLDTVSLRYFNVYGPRYAVYDHSALVYFLERSIKGLPPIIYGTGKQIRDYTYIDDVVDGTMLALKKHCPGEIFNIGFGTGTRIIDLAKKIIAVSGKNIKPEMASTGDYRYIPGTMPYGITKKVGRRYIDTRNFVADITKAKKILRYSPKVSIDAGIKKTYGWLFSEMKKNRNL